MNGSPSGTRGSLTVLISNGPNLVVNQPGLTTEQAAEAVCSYLPVVPVAEVARLVGEVARLKRLLDQRGRDAADAEDDAERLREEYKRIVWCHSGPGGISCPACAERAQEVLGDA